MAFWNKIKSWFNKCQHNNNYREFRYESKEGTIKSNIFCEDCGFVGKTVIIDNSDWLGTVIVRKQYE